MSRRGVIAGGIILAAVLAGLLWYQLTRPVREALSPSTTPIAWETNTPEPEGGAASPRPAFVPEEQRALITTPTGPDSVDAVSPSAPTGPATMTLFASLLGATGITGGIVLLKRS